MAILDLFNLKGKVALVTGASTGLGQGIALGLADAGALIVGVDYVEMSETKTLIENAGGKFHGIVSDLIKANVNDLKDLVSETVKVFGKIDILVNNAGIIRRQPSLEFSENNWDDVLQINLKTVFFLSQAAANQFIAQKSTGKIINIASMLAYEGGILVPSYTASKSGVKGVTMTMANEWAQYGINVNAIAPGYMATNNTEAIRNDKAREKTIIDRIPANRWGLPSDIAGTAVFLASDNSNYINGFTIAVDGGWLAR